MKNTVTLEELTNPQTRIPIRFGLKELLKGPSEGGIGPAIPAPPVIPFETEIKSVEDILGGKKRI